jgi:hypothetical protein
MKNKCLLSVFLLALALMGCGGGGGGSPSHTQNNLTSTFPAPKAVAGTSYGNKHEIVLDNPQVTALSASDGRTVTFGDFFQEGEYSAFIAVDVSGIKEARFLKKVGTVWIDYTGTILPVQSERSICSDVAQAITADFNGDGKPDVFVVCGMSAASSQYIFMSQLNSANYTRHLIANATGTAIALQAWGAAAADIDGDSDIDVVITDNNSVVTLENTINTNGRWVKHTDWITGQNVGLNFPTMPRKVFLVPTSNSRPDLVVGGDGSANNVTLVWMKSSNAFSPPYYSFNDNSSVSAYAPAYSMGVSSSATIYDVVKTLSNLIVLAKNVNLANESSASSMVLLRYDLPVASQALSLTSGQNTVSYTGGLISQFKLTSTGSLVAYDGSCAAGQAKCAFVATP